MFIQWGTSGKVKNGGMVRKQCRHCSAPSMYLLILYKVFNIFYIPIFPYGKSYYLSCDKCEAQYEIKDSDRGSMTVKYAWYHFLGLILIACMIVWGQIDSRIEKANRLAYKKHPMTNDIVLYYNKEDVKTPYGYFKIIDNIEDGYVVQHSKYVYEKFSDASKEMKKESADAFVEVTYMMSPEDIDEIDVVEWRRRSAAPSQGQ